MTMKLISKFNRLPLYSTGIKPQNQSIRDSPLNQVIVDILDDDIWGSKFSVCGNFLLIFAIISSTAIYLITNGGMSKFDGYNLINWILGLLFLAEYILRILYAQRLGFKSNAQFSFMFSFIGLIDLFTLVPFILEFSGISLVGAIGAIRILRLWRVVRYIPSFKVISDAFNSKKEDILTSLVAVILLSLTLSAFMFHFEISNTGNKFKSISEVFIWSLGKYTGDYGSISLNQPLSLMGKTLATINGLLGIALFALPAGLLASAFIEQLEEKRKNTVNQERIALIKKYFSKKTGGGKGFIYKTHPRYASIDYLQTKFLLSESELFECVRICQNMRFRARKSSPELKFSDIKIIESFELNCSYGFRQWNEESNVVIINAIGNNEQGISHLSYALGQNLNTNFLSRELTILNANGDPVGGNKSTSYKNKGSSPDENPMIKEFLDDIKSIKKNQTVIILSSAASGRKDLILEYGNQENETEWKDGTTTLNSQAELSKIRGIVKTESTNVLYKGANQVETIKDFTLEENSIGVNKDDSLLRLVRSETQANTIAIYININLLTGNDNEYYCTMASVGNMIKAISKEL